MPKLTKRNKQGRLVDFSAIATVGHLGAEFDALLASMQTPIAKRNMAAAFNDSSAQLARAAVASARLRLISNLQSLPTVESIKLRPPRYHFMLPRALRLPIMPGVDWQSHLASGKMPMRRPSWRRDRDLCSAAMAARCAVPYLAGNGRITLQRGAWDEHSCIVRLFFPTPFSSEVGLVGLLTARVQRGESATARCASKRAPGRILPPPTLASPSFPLVQ